MDQELLKKYRTLDREIQDFLFSKKILSSLIEISEENKITEEQASKIADQIFLVILGNQTKDDFAKELGKFGLDGNGAKLVAQQIDRRIFSQVEPKKTDAKEKNIETSKILPARLQQFIETGEWKQGVAKVGRQFNLKEGEIQKLEEQTLLILNCTEMPSALKENIKRELGLDENAGRRITDSINGVVFSQVMRDIKNAWNPRQGIENNEYGIKEEKKKIEEIDYVAMARAMQPAGTPVVKTVPPPTNLPTENRGSHVIHNYVAGNDPYREPLE